MKFYKPDQCCKYTPEYKTPPKYECDENEPMPIYDCDNDCMPMTMPMSMPMCDCDCEPMCCEKKCVGTYTMKCRVYQTCCGYEMHKVCPRCGHDYDIEKHRECPKCGAPMDMASMDEASTEDDPPVGDPNGFGRQFGAQTGFGRRRFARFRFPFFFPFFPFFFFRRFRRRY